MFLKDQGSSTRTVRISQLSKIIFQGLFPSRATKPIDSNRRIPIINIKDIVNGQINPNDIDIIIIDANKNIERYIVLPGDVIVSCRGTVLKSAVVPEDLRGFYIASNLIAIRLNGSFDSLLLSAFFQSPIGQRILLSSNRSSTMQIALTVSDIGKIEIPMIPLDIQKKLSGLITVANQYYKCAIESAELRRNIANKIVLNHLCNQIGQGGNR